MLQMLEAPRPPPRAGQRAWMGATVGGVLLGVLGGLGVWWGVVTAGPPPGGDQLGYGFLYLACGLPFLGLPLGVLQSRALRASWGRDRWHLRHSVAWTVITCTAGLLGVTLPWLSRASGTVFAHMLLTGPQLLLLSSEILLLFSLPAWSGRTQQRAGALCAGAGLLLLVLPFLAVRISNQAPLAASPLILGTVLGLILVQSGLLAHWAWVPAAPPPA